MCQTNQVTMIIIHPFCGAACDLQLSESCFVACLAYQLEEAVHQAGEIAPTGDSFE